MPASSDTDFLVDIPFVLAVEGVDTDGHIGNNVQFLDGSALMIDVTDVGGTPDDFDTTSKQPLERKKVDLANALEQQQEDHNPLA